MLIVLIILAALLFGCSGFWAYGSLGPLYGQGISIIGVLVIFLIYYRLH